MALKGKQQSKRVDASHINHIARDWQTKSSRCTSYKQEARQRRARGRGRGDRAVEAEADAGGARVVGVLDELPERGLVASERAGRGRGERGPGRGRGARGRGRRGRRPRRRRSGWAPGARPRGEPRRSAASLRAQAERERRVTAAAGEFAECGDGGRVLLCPSVAWKENDLIHLWYRLLLRTGTKG
jgi:hypothetical protein